MFHRTYHFIVQSLGQKTLGISIRHVSMRKLFQASHEAKVTHDTDLLHQALTHQKHTAQRAVCACVCVCALSGTMQSFSAVHHACDLH